ncbi:cytochrome b/b6 domain-containing protein [Salinibacterium sp. G-O1]|uniref:cytochrome b/b6 domain-containing protein n=1 Tax=Salinibacterium sp. G-O1 TaxID=3046208 RepID=UPI0024BA9A93|nr:cytochrome b/b6 domain-containing protein [Salinibacterium sp. G-O1]MDJ0335897.1 cytochrome b/b6 domain-containing protein [Salinibacterium sp. G-O1]
MIPAGLALVILVVLAARGIRELPAVQSFMSDYPGESELPADAPVGFPAWLGWQHFLNSFFMLFIIRTGWEIRKGKRPAAFWTRNNTGLLKTKNPPVRIGLPVWFHLTVDSLWVLNGVVFYILLFATGQWVRVIPVSWDVIPNALSAALQYASMNWPTENGWLNYNALQLLAYFVTTFIAAPLALATGIRMAPGFATKFRKFDKVFPLPVARAIHFPVMIYFVAFIIVHVVLVLLTGALRNLNHMYAARDDQGWLGLAFFAGSIVLMVAGWFAARPTLLAPVAGLTGKVRR